MRTIDIKDKNTFPKKGEWCWHFKNGSWIKTKKLGDFLHFYNLPDDWQDDKTSWLPCDPQGWIRVEDGLPPDDGKYIVHSTESYRDFWGSSWDATLQEWVHDMSHSPDPTHWQPAPQPPTKEGNDAD